MSIAITDITINCSDNYKLSATVYTPKNIKAAVIMAPATGIKKTFYNSFASYLAENGFGVLCYNNRGIDSSLKGEISNSKATLIDWGQLDMSAVFKELQNRFPNTKYHLVGHSAGGQLIGLMDDPHKLSSIFNVACSSGSLKNMQYPFKFSALFFLNCFIPLSNLIVGHTKSQWVGMGEPLPKNVAKQWRKWCNSKGYIKVELGTTIKEHHYDSLEIPSQWIHATDDGIANYANVVDMASVYTKLPSEIITLEPKEYDFKDIGHMKFFSSKRKALWQYALDWLNSNS